MRKVKQYLPILAVVLLTCAVISAGGLRRMDRWVQDELFQHPGTPSADIVIIGIDEKALELFGPYYTWDRNIMASALEALAADPDKRPAAVAADVLYSGDTTPEADARLAQAAEALGCVVSASMAQFGSEITWEEGLVSEIRTGVVTGYEEPYDALKNCTVQGHINAMCDRDGILRHALLYVEIENEKIFSMAYQAARLYLEQRGEGMRDVPVNRAGHFYVPFTGRPGTYYDDVSIADLIAGKVPPEYWADKIVFIGAYAPALQDAYFTSIDKGRQMFGVEFQANVTQSLLEGSGRREVSEKVQFVLLTVFCILAGIFYMRLKAAPGAVLCLGLCILGAGGAVCLYHLGWITHPLWIPVSAVVLYLFSLVCHYIRAVRERQALALEKERLATELSLAARIQKNALPTQLPQCREFSLHASMTPAREVGGDLYDYFMIDEDHLALVIGDVSGKGFPSALFMMVAITLFRHVAMRESSPAKILQVVNEEMCARNPEEMFVTVWLGILEISTGKLTAANAGHEYPVLKRPGDHFEMLKDRHGFVVGGMEGTRYTEYELQLESGEKLFLYTDGVPEALNTSQEQFGTERMVSALRTKENSTPADIVEAVRTAVEHFTAGEQQFDDLTMLCLHYNGDD